MIVRDVTNFFFREKKKLFFLAYSLTVTFFVFFKFPQQFHRFNDEFNNVWKADNGLIFDYSLRPFSFLINYIFISITTPDPLILSLLSSLILIVGLLQLFKVVSADHFLGFLLLTFLTVTSVTVFQLGTAGMVHSTVFLLSILVVSFYLKLNSSLFKGVVLSLLTIICLLSHPSSLFFLIPFYGLRFLSNYNNNSLYFEVFLLFSYFIFVNLLYFLASERTYVSFLLDVPAKIESLEHKYNPGYFYYFEHLLKEFKYVFLGMGLLIPFSNLKCIFAAIEKEKKVVLLATVGAVFIASFAGWKFLRVLYQFYGLIILFLHILISEQIKCVVKSKRSRYFLAVGLCSFGVLITFKNSIHQIKSYREAVSKRYLVKTAQIDYLESFGMDSVIVLTRDISYNVGAYDRGLLLFPKLNKKSGRDYLNIKTENQLRLKLLHSRAHFFVENDFGRVREHLDKMEKYRKIFKNDYYILYYNTEREKKRRYWEIPLLK